MLTLNPRQIATLRSQWRPVSRGEAIGLCNSHKVVVIQPNVLGESAQWFDSRHPFYRGDGPYASALSGLLYFVCLDGATILDRAAHGPAGQRHAKAFDPFDASNYTPYDEPEETKLYPITFELLSSNGKPLSPTPYEIVLPDGSKRSGTSGADGFIKYLTNRTPGKAKLKLLPGNKVKVVEPENGESESNKFPIEIELQSSLGKPLANQAYTLILSDGESIEGVSDAQGFIRHPDNEVPGEVELLLREAQKPKAQVEKPKVPHAVPVAPVAPPIAADPAEPEKPKEAPEKTTPGYRPGYLGKEEPASAPTVLDFSITEKVLKDLSEDEFRQAFVDAALLMEDLGLNRSKGAERSEAYLDMVTWDEKVRAGWKNDHSINTSSCGMFVRNIWWLCGARGTSLLDAPYTSGVLTDLVKFDTKASRQWGSEVTAKTFFPKIGDVLYLYHPTTRSQHIFIICGIDKKIVEENGETVVYNADGTLAKEIAFTSVDGGQADGVGPDGNGKSQTWGCQGIHKCVRKIKLSNGRFPNLGSSWPFPDKAPGRPINSWISIWEARAKFTAPLIKPLRLGPITSQQAQGDTSLYYVRIQLDEGEARQLEEKFVLSSTDGSFVQTKTVHDDLIEGDDYLDLQFTEVPKSLAYSLKVVPPTGEGYFIYQGVDFADLDGYVP